MRYGLELVERGAFGPDVKIGVRLQDEPAIVVPEECPECPPGACTPSFIAWDYMMTMYQGTLISEQARIECPESGPAARADSFPVESILVSQIIVPLMDRCGHKTRLVFDEGTIDFSGDDSYQIITGVDGNDTGLMVMLADAALAGKGTAQMQIDLTDDETWTDIGCPFEIGGNG